jgi:hypothetical protein
LGSIEWNAEKGLEAASQFRRRNLISDLLWSEVRPHVALVWERIQFAVRHYKVDFGYSPTLFVEKQLSLGPTFTALWADKWKQGRFDWAGTRRIDSDINPHETMPWPSYDGAFSPYFMIFWSDYTDDYLQMKIPLTGIFDQEIHDELEETISDLSDELIPDGDITVPDEFIFEPTSTSSWWDRKIMPEWELEYDAPELDIPTDRLTFVRSQAMKRPSETRDIGLHTPQSLRLHRELMYPLQRACRKIPSCVYAKDSSYVRDTVSTIGSRNRFFFMRDYTKSGMSIPKDVIATVFRGFYRRWPSVAKKAIHAFDNAVVWIRTDDPDHWEFFHPSTGLPLGMFVEGYTLLQYAIDRMVQARLPGPYPPFDYNATNDDMIAASKSEAAIEDYARTDFFINQSLRMSVKTSKSGISENRFFYCEEYWDSTKLLPKESQCCLALLGAKFAINVVHAKELVNAILMSLPYFSLRVSEAIATVVESYDYEFSADEHQWPYLFGGWKPMVKDGLDYSIDWRNGDCIVDMAYWASREAMHEKPSFREEPTMAYSRKKKIRFLKEPDDRSLWPSLIPLFGTHRALKRYYKLLSRDKKTLKRTYDRLWIMRQRAFHAYMTGKKECPSVLIDWLIRHPTSYIPDKMPGVTYSSDIQLVHQPIIGSNLTSREMWLHAMHTEGIIEYQSGKKFSNSELLLRREGILQQCPYDYIAVPRGGLSARMLNTNFRGLSNFFHRTGKGISKVSESDPLVPYTRLWYFLPNVPLTYLVRVDRIHKTVPEMPAFSEDTVHYWRNVFAEFRHPEPGENPVVSVVESESDSDPLFEERLRDMIAGLLDGHRIQLLAKTSKAPFPGLTLDHEVPVRHGQVDVNGLIKIGEGSWLDPDQSIASTIWDRSSESGSEYGDPFEHLL